MENTNVVKFDDVKNLSTEDYFQGNQFSIDAFKKKYAIDNKESYINAVKRVCDFVASVESTQELRDYWSARWFDEIFNDWWHPAGSIMQGAGSGRKISLANCFSRDTEFITDEGIRTFEWFIDGRVINVMNNYGAFVPATVRNFGPQRLYKLTLGRHTLKKEVYCTSEHIWRTVEKGGTIIEKTTKNLSPFDQLPYVKRKWMPSSNVSRYYCPIGFIHGYVFGDGDYDKATNTCRLHLCGDSKELLRLFSGFNWSVKETEETATIQYLPSHFKQEMPDLDKYNEEYVLGFLIGYFAADGSVDEEGRAYLACAHDDVLLRLKKIIESLGIYCSDIRLMRNKSPFDGNPNHQLYGMHIWKDCLFDSFFTKTNHKQNWEIHKNSLVNDKSKVNWKVISLEETDRIEDVWCVQVPEFHNFTLSGGLNTGNCTTISLGAKRDDEEWDSLESIIKNTAYTIAKCAAYRQGLGVDFSRLRPCGTKVLNSANQSTGAVHWMEFEDKIGYFVGQKGRIPAMLFSISCDHPDVEEFIQVKSDYTKIQNANISVQCTEKFYKAVEADEDWELSFTVPALKKGDKVYIDVHSTDAKCVREKETGRYYRLATHDRKKEVFTKTVKARKLMELIAKNMHQNAEPGIQNIDIARKYSNSDALYNPNDEYDSRILSTNAPLIGKTLIPTPGGLIPIQELYGRTEAMVLSDSLVTLPPVLIDSRHNERVWGRYNFPTRTFPVLARFRKYENQKVWKITLSNKQELQCNGEHKWLINGKMVSTKDIKIGDKLFKPNGGIVQACDYNVDFTSKDFNVGEIVGYVVGNGWVGKESPTHNKMIGIVYDDDCRHYSDSFRLLYSEITGDFLTYERQRNSIFEVRTENTAFVSFFETFGIVDSKYVIPSRCYTDLTFCAGFLRGLYQADGYVRWNGKQGQIVLTSASKDVVDGVRDLMANWFGIHTTLKVSDSCGVEYETVFGEKKISNCKLRYDLVISTREHLLRFRKYIGLVGNKGKVLNEIHGNCQQYNNRISVNIESVVETDLIEDMFCAEIDGLHAFVVDGCLSSNCSEQYLSRESLCVLASLNCGKFSSKREIFQTQLEKISKSVNRFLDNINECELVHQTYATPHQELAIRKLRRTGAGITNIAAWLFRKNLAYGTKEANDAVEEFVKWLNYWLYISTEELGLEKGDFGLFNKDKWRSAPFVARMMKESEKLHAECGVPILKGTHARNVTVSSIAPTGCIEENTRIVTNEGMVKIKDLIDNKPCEKQFVDYPKDVFVCNEKTNSDIISYYNNGVINGYVLTLEDGRQLKMSETHRIRVITQGKYEWKYAPDITADDIVVSYLNIDRVSPKYVTLDTSLTSEHHNVSECKLPEKLTEQLAEYIGMFTGDGSIKFRTENGKVDGVRFPVFGGDTDLVSHIVNLTKELFGLNCNVIKSADKDMHEISTHSINLGEYLINNGFEKKSNISDIEHCKERAYNIPEHIFRSPKSVIAAYLRGLFESDGSISDGHITFYSKYEHITRQVQELLMYLGIQSYLSKIVKGEDGWNSEMFRATIRYKSSNLKYRELVGFISQRKSQLLGDFDYEIDRERICIDMNLARTIQKTLSRELSSKSKLYCRLTTAICNNKLDKVIYLNRDILDDISQYVELDLYLPFALKNYVTSRVKSIHREMFQTYDIEVSDSNHTYITANGIINHNTLSLMFRDFVLSYGIEPAFFMYFWKRTRMGGNYEYYFCVPRVVREMFKEAGHPIPMDSDTVKDTWDGKFGTPIAKFIDTYRHLFKFKEAPEIAPMDKLQLMSQVMKWIDSSISVTYMLPIGSTWKDVYNFIMEAHRREVKSIAAFPDKKMYGIVSSLPFKELAFKLKSEGVNIHHQNFADDELKELHLSRESIQEVTHVRPDRPAVLDADIHVVTVKGDKFVLVVGILNDKPYEMFGGHINGFGFKFQQKKGKMRKIKTDQYALEIDDIVIEDFSKQFTPTEQILFRFVSLTVGSGLPIQEAVDQLQKGACDITSLGAAAARVLKKYIKNGTLVDGQKCPSCGSQIVFIDGCTTCVSCGYSKCG